MNIPRAGTIASSSVPGTDAQDAADAQIVLVVLQKAGLPGAAAPQVGAAANLDVERVKTLLLGLVANGRAIVVSKPNAYLDADVARATLERAIERLDQHQVKRPWLMGLTSLGLAQSLEIPETILVRVLGAFVASGALAYRSGYYATLDFAPRLHADQQAFFDAAFAVAGPEPSPVSLEQLRTTMRTSGVPELSSALETLLACGELCKVGDYIYRGSHLRAIRAELEEALRGGERITVAQFRDLTGTSRKYAVPLLEYFDATGITIRSGDLRVSRQTPLHKR